MLKFFQTRLGQEFYQSLVPRIANALETIASNQELDSNLRERLEVLELALDLPCGEVTCADGYTFRLSTIPYTNLFYISFPSNRDSLIDKYMDKSEEDTVVSYSKVPCTTVAQLILNHGNIRVDEQLV